MADLTRRDMLVQAGLAVGAALTPTDAEAQKTASPVREGELKTLTRLEYDTLDAICARLIPTDENGPGAREAKAARYIDWGLGGALNVRNAREQYASALAAVEAYAVSNKGASFAKLASADQDAIVTLLQNSQIPSAPMGFFNTIRTHTIQGTFSDPYYGGNYNGIGWDIIKYPGVRTTVPAEYQQWKGTLKPNRQSAYDHEMFGKGEL
jgi:gluconate 2-dehydrogenase gamma chain